MSTSIRSRLFMSILAVVLLGMGLASVLVWQSVEGMYLDTQRENLLAQARMSAAALEGQPIPIESTQVYSQTSNVLPGIHTHLLAEAGGVIVTYPFQEAAIPVPPVENTVSVSAKDLSQRTEIIRALQGEAATAIRKVDSTVGRRVLYAAAPVMGTDGKVSGVVYLAMPLPVGGLPVDLLWKLIGAILAAAFLAIISGMLIARRVARPVEAISQAALAVSSGDLDLEVPEQNQIRELDTLGKAFNTMTASLRQSDQAKNAFIADVTHELRTPLTVIKGTIETLEDGALDDIEGRGPLLVSMQQETERLIRLVNDLLVLTRADAGSLNLDLVAVDLAELGRARCQNLSRLAGQRRIRLEVTGAASQVKGDVDRLSQVLDNLLDNAIRYSPEGGRITVEVRGNGAEVYCSVTDQGTGIPQQHLEHIFDRFYRVEPSRNRKSGGAGLGLAIAQALVLAHGGRIWAESSSGSGTTITFCVPLSRIALEITEF
jgi:two-component system, OmpR family, sensor histidine kinase BaeS